MRKCIQILSIPFLLALFLPGCSTAKIVTGTQQINYPVKDTTLIIDMAEYALIFAKKNNVSEFQTRQVADRTIRRKISSLGALVKINYNSSGIYHNSVVFKTTNFSGVREYIYDFSSLPKNLGTDTSSEKKYFLLQTSERTYYQQRPFPMM